ncbi:hypothetical protein RQP46_008124 [Phenoliferia psychrophenolica]
MGFFNKRIVTFTIVNILRTVSIGAILLALAGEVLVMKSREDDLTGTTLIKSTALASTSPAGSDTCAYITDTTVPRKTGGIFFSTLERVFVCLILVLMLVSELPLPFQFMQRFWTFAFPPFGNEHGVAFLGLVQLFISGSILAKSVTGLAQVSGWVLGGVALLNIFLGMVYGAKIKALRASRSDVDKSGVASPSRVDAPRPSAPLKKTPPLQKDEGSEDFMLVAGMVEQPAGGARGFK